MRDQEIREALNQHWSASNSGDFATEHRIYHEDAILDYPQSRETQYFAGPFVASEWRKQRVHNMDRGHGNATVRTCAIAMATASLIALAQFGITDVRIAMLVYVVQVFLFTSFTVATSASLAQITPAPLSGKLQAIVGLASILVGLALGQLLSHW